MKLDRRAFLAAGAASALVGTAAATPSAPSLAALAAEKGIAFGSAFDREIFEDAPYANLLKRECRIGAIANSLKFDWLRPTSPDPDYAVADQLVDFAVAAGMKPHGAALIWNDWPTDWIKRASNSERRYWFDRHISETVTHYAGRVKSWDAVNEPFWPPGNDKDGMREGPWLDAFGRGYVARAFERAAAADPAATLVLNEAFCEQNDDLGNAVRPRLLTLATELKHQGARIDAVGFQAHLKPHLPFDDAGFAAYVAEFAALGIAVHITELDVDDSGLPDDVAARDAMVAARVHDFLSAVLRVPAVDTVICWHLSDRYSWYDQVPWYADQTRKMGGDPKRGARSHVYDHDMKPKPAAEALATVFRNSAPRDLRR